MAQQAFDITLKDNLDVIVTDVVMSVISGFELYHLLKKYSATQNLSNIICTSKNQPIDRLWGMKQPE